MKAKPESNNLIEGKREHIPGNSFDKKIERPRLLLHSCCGPCSTSVIERLAGEFNITVFFYNPCIDMEEEYRRRRQTQIKFIEEFNTRRIDLENIGFMEGDYEPKVFLNLVKGHEDEREGGSRCSICFRQRLEKTAETARLTGCDYFGTTLTVSPHKNYQVISTIGRETALKYGLTFLDRDFKKQDGFKRSIEMSREYELYRQGYCGCSFSNKQMKKEER